MAKDLKLGPSVFSVFIRTWAPGLDQSRVNMNPRGDLANSAPQGAPKQRSARAFPTCRPRGVSLMP